MEETDMCHLTATLRSLQQAIPNGCPIKALAPSDRLTVGVQALAGTRPITRLAGEYDVSRKFVYQQRSTAHTALQEAFASAEVADDQVLFQLPVTKAWLRQATLGLTLICHSSVFAFHDPTRVRPRPAHTTSMLPPTNRTEMTVLSSSARRSASPTRASSLASGRMITSTPRASPSRQSLRGDCGWVLWHSTQVRCMTRAWA